MDTNPPGVLPLPNKITTRASTIGFSRPPYRLKMSSTPPVKIVLGTHMVKYCRTASARQIPNPRSRSEILSLNPVSRTMIVKTKCKLSLTLSSAAATMKSTLHATTRQRIQVPLRSASVEVGRLHSSSYTPKSAVVHQPLTSLTSSKRV